KVRNLRALTRLPGVRHECVAQCVLIGGTEVRTVSQRVSIRRGIAIVHHHPGYFAHQSAVTLPSASTGGSVSSTHASVASSSMISDPSRTSIQAAGSTA